MRSFFATLRQLVIPAGAGPGSPAIVIGPDIPPELVTWANLFGITLDAVIIYRRTSTSYVWEGVGSFGGNTTRFRGTYDLANGVILTQRTIIGGAGIVTETFGAGFNPLALTVNFINPTDITYDGVSMGRGVWAYVSSTTAVGPFAANTAILNTPFINLRAGRVIRVQWETDVVGDLAYVDALFHLRTGSAVGPIVRQAATFATNNIDTVVCGSTCFLTAASPLGFFGPLYLTAAAPIGGNITIRGLAGAPYWLHVEDVGDTAKYPGSITI